VIDLRRHQTILGGLVRALAEVTSLQQWASIALALLRMGEWTQTQEVMLELFRYAVKPKEGVEAGPVFREMVARQLTRMLRDIQNQEGAKGEPWLLLVDAMLRELGPGESICWFKVGRADALSTADVHRQ
jgi:hypothetical protein